MEARKGFHAAAMRLTISPGKLRRVAANVRNRSFTEAIAILDSLPHKGARFLKKALQSAAANALVQNKNLDEQVLYIKELLVDDGPRSRRVWPRSRGKRDILLKRTSHVSVIVDERTGG